MNISPVVRVIGFAVLALAAVVGFVVMRPDARPEPPTEAAAIMAAVADAQLNEISASSAPQQQVVNGWVARDLLEINARQNDELIARVGASADERVAWLLLMAVLAVCWFGMTAPRGARRVAEVDGGAAQEEPAGGTPPAAIRRFP